MRHAPASTDYASTYRITNEGPSSIELAVGNSDDILTELAPGSSADIASSIIRVRISGNLLFAVDRHGNEQLCSGEATGTYEEPARLLILAVVRYLLLELSPRAIFSSQKHFLRGQRATS